MFITMQSFVVLVVSLPVLLAGIQTTTARPPAGTCQEDKVNNDTSATCVNYHFLPNFKDPGNLISLDLTGNHLEGITSVPFLALRTLILRNNQIGGVSDEAFKGCHAMKTLDLSINWIAAVSDMTFMDLDKLENLNISHNNLGNLSSPSFNFKHVQQNLKILDVSYNHIEVISDDVIINLKALTDLSFKHNNMVEIPPIKGLTALKNLDLSDNDFANVNANSFKDLEALTDLDLSHNKIKEVAEFGFDGLKSLTTLNLAHNKLGSIVDYIFKDLLSLEVLNLDNNEMGYFQNNGLPPSLKHFSMVRSSEMTVIQPEMFKGVRQLKSVRISHTDIADIRADAFDHSGKLIETVDLSNNHIATLTEDLLLWENITNLDLTNNPWNCDCKLAWMKDVLPNVAKNLTCASPEKYKNQRLSEAEISRDKCQVYGRPDHHSLYVAVTVITLIMILIAVLLAVMHHCKKRAAKYRSLREDTSGSVQFSTKPGDAGGPGWLEDGAVQYRDGRGAREEMIKTEDDNTLFSID